MAMADLSSLSKFRGTEKRVQDPPGAVEMRGMSDGIVPDLCPRGCAATRSGVFDF